MRSGRFRRSKLLPILWDLPARMVYCSAGGSAFEKLGELFERSLGLKLLSKLANTSTWPSALKPPRSTVLNAKLLEAGLSAALVEINSVVDPMTSRKKISEA